MALTLNQIVSRLRSLALSHEQVNKFYFGDSWEVDVNGDNDHAMCLVTAEPSTVNRTTHLTTFNFKVSFLDLVGVSTRTEQNETEVLSDMSSVMQDFLSMLMFHDYQDDWVIGDIAPFELVTEKYGDMVAGVEVDISISVDFAADRCQVPSSDVTFEDPFDMARTRILTYEGTGSEGDSFAVSNLSGKTVLAVYRAGIYKRAITTVPTDTEKIGVGGTDLGNRKGIMSGGTASLSSGDALLAGEILDFLIYE